MRARLQMFGFLAMACFAPIAMAETLTLDATQGAPLIDVTVNGQSARLLVDGRMDFLAALNPDAAKRLDVAIVPLIKANASLDERTTMPGRISRPNMTFANGETKRQIAGLFGLPTTERADGVIGPTALPYDDIVIILREGPQAPVTKVLKLKKANEWRWREDLGDVETLAMFDFEHDDSFISRPAAASLATSGALTPRGELVKRPFLLGLDIMVQPVTVNFETSSNNFDVTKSIAQTDAPIVAPTGSDTIIVQAPGKESKRTPLFTLGRNAIKACSDLAYSRKAKTLTLHCDR